MEETCEGCDGSGVRPDAPNHTLKKIPRGYVCIEKCDACDKFASDLEAAEAWGIDAQWWSDNQLPVRSVAIAKPKTLH